MNITLPDQLQQTLASRAARLGVPPESLIQQALVWYLAIEEEVVEELADWQRVRDEALDLIEGSAP